MSNLSRKHSQVGELQRDLADLKGGTGESRNLFIILSGRALKPSQDQLSVSPGFCHCDETTCFDPT